MAIGDKLRRVAKALLVGDGETPGENLARVGEAGPVEPLTAPIINVKSSHD
jgi:hypothetical protein